MDLLVILLVILIAAVAGFVLARKVVNAAESNAAQSDEARVLLNALAGRDAVQPSEPPVNSTQFLSPTSKDRKTAAFHIARFERAIAQCTNPDKLPELERWLAYYQAIAAAEQARVAAEDVKG